MSFIRLKDLYFSYGDEPVFESINEEFEKGKCNIITSIAGEGKTTFLKLIAGLKYPTKGEIYIENTPLSSFNKKQMLDYHRRTGFLFQDAALINNLNIYDNLALFYKYNTKLKDDEILEKLKRFLEYFDLMYAIYLKPEQLSHGLQMVVSFIRAILGDPDIILLDEPIETLDQILAKKMIEEINRLKNEGKTLIISTHRIHFFANIADKIIILKDRKIIFSNAFEKLNENYIGNHIRDLIEL